MAITSVEYALIRRLRELGLIKTGGTLIEFGEANWYGDVTLDTLRADLASFAPEERKTALRAELDQVEAGKPKFMDFDLVRIFYDCFLAPTARVAIDLHGTKTALKLNLNEPVAGALAAHGGPFDIMFDFGTAEHVFDVRQFFANAHDVTKPGGLMIHGLPWTGWIDHGFYNFQPTLFFDLAAANGYTLHTAATRPPRRSRWNPSTAAMRSPHWRRKGVSPPTPRSTPCSPRPRISHSGCPCRGTTAARSPRRR